MNVGQAGSYQVQRHSHEIRPHLNVIQNSLSGSDLTTRGNDIVPLTLPLPIESGNAIADYLLNARPKNNSPYVFLTKDQPHRPLVSVGTIIPRYIKKAGVLGNVSKRSGFHSFRRSYWRQLLEAETTLDILSELLGQLNVNSAKPYIAADEQRLKRCALSLVDSRKAGDVL